jgi:hypothetical protein
LQNSNLVGALVIVASLSANVYLAKKVSDNPRPPKSRDVTTDERVVIRTNGGLLEVTTIKSSEAFEVLKDHTVFGIPVGTTVSRIRVPATFRYQVELAREWKILLRDKTFIVIAPVVKPSLPVAIDTARLEKESFGVWSIFTGGAQLDQLQRSITQQLGVKASTPSYVQFQREEARKTVTEFVAKWLITQEQWKSASSYPIKVYFADEPIQALSTMPQPFAGLL